MDQFLIKHFYTNNIFQNKKMSIRTFLLEKVNIYFLKNLLNILSTSVCVHKVNRATVAILVLQVLLLSKRPSRFSGPPSDINAVHIGSIKCM